MTDQCKQPFQDSGYHIKQLLLITRDLSLGVHVQPPLQDGDKLHESFLIARYVAEQANEWVTKRSIYPLQAKFSDRGPPLLDLTLNECGIEALAKLEHCILWVPTALGLGEQGTGLPQCELLIIKVPGGCLPSYDGLVHWRKRVTVELEQPSILYRL